MTQTTYRAYFDTLSESTTIYSGADEAKARRAFRENCAVYRPYAISDLTNWAEKDLASIGLDKITDHYDEDGGYDSTDWETLDKSDFVFDRDKI